MDAVLTAELYDSEEQTYFFFQVGAPGDGHPTTGQVEECFTCLLANLLGGPETYPPGGGVNDSANPDAGLWMCRDDMTTIHRPLRISGGTFDKFVMIAGAVLASPPFSLDSMTVTAVTNVLGGFKPSIVTPALSDAGAAPYTAGQ